MPDPACGTGCQGVRTIGLCMHPGSTARSQAGSNFSATVAGPRVAPAAAQARAQLTCHFEDVLRWVASC